MDISENDIICSVCEDGYALISDNSDCYQDICKPIYAVIQSNCLSQNSASCLLCDMGFNLINGSCNPVVANCKTFSTSSVCSECEDYYYLESNYCYKIENISHCIKGNNSYCTECADGYAYLLDHLSCKSITDSNCDEGYWNDTSFVCTECADGYYY